MGFEVVHYFNETQSLAFDKAGGDLNKIFTLGTINADADMSQESLRNGDWNVVFVSDTINAEDRDFATWSESSDSSLSFTCQAAASTTWS